ncbi:hypothetical protein BKA65DRAFT_503110 [Rhexocercosporidium sp. MPI-PUGE-AT-0058]|nr:hypothetical protein BKA65DRAFT_503110 [Rhexocercosporidium sp. MPI-PUGE-AT-0058]
MASQVVLNSQRVSTKLGSVTSPSAPSTQAAPRSLAANPRKSRSKGPPNPTRFTKFHQFKKIPPEIRLKIWRYTMRPRVIRAEYQNIDSELVHKDVRLSRYVLDAGPVPTALRVNSESRQEALKFYNLVKAKLPVKTLERDGERLPPGAQPPKMPAWLDVKIYVNPSSDVFFFVNFPSTLEFLTYFRRISRPSIGGIPLNNPIKHIALVGEDTQRFRTSGRTDLFYLLCMEHPKIQTINIVLDNSKFREDPKPETYSLWKVDPLPEDSMRGGGQHGGREVREHCIDIFRNFWEGKKTVRDFENWLAWREMNKGWTPPKVMLKSIAKVQRLPPVKRVTKVVVEVETGSESGSEDEDGKSTSQASS